MGNLCRPKNNLDQLPTDEDGHHHDTINIDNSQTTQTITMTFTTQKLIHLSSDLLILFMDHTTKICKNQHFIKLPMQGQKLEEYLKAYLEKIKLQGASSQQSKKFVIVPIMIPTLNFKKVAVIFCDIWKQDTNNRSNLQDLLAEFFVCLQKQKSSTIIMTEFIFELGIPIQTGSRILVKLITKMNKKPQSIQFCCLGEQSKQIYKQVVKQGKQELSLSFISQSQSNSVYY